MHVRNKACMFALDMKGKFILYHCCRFQSAGNVVLGYGSPQERGYASTETNRGALLSNTSLGYTTLYQGRSASCVKELCKPYREIKISLEGGSSRLSFVRPRAERPRTSGPKLLALRIFRRYCIGGTILFSTTLSLESGFSNLPLV